jgi:hypothetical protein
MSITPPATPDPDKMAGDDETDDGKDFRPNHLPQIILDNGHSVRGFTPSPSISPPATASSSLYASHQQTPTRNTTPSFGSPMLAGLGISGVGTGGFVEDVELAEEDDARDLNTQDREEEFERNSRSDSGTPTTIMGLSHSASFSETPTNLSSPASPFGVSQKSNIFGRADEHERIHRVRQHEHQTFKKNSPPSPTDTSGIVMERFEDPLPELSDSNAPSSSVSGFLDPFGTSHSGSRLSSPFNPSSGQLYKQSSPLRDQLPWIQDVSPEKHAHRGRGSLSSPPPLSPSHSSSPSRANSNVSISSARRMTPRSSVTRTPPSSGKTLTFPTVAKSTTDEDEYTDLDQFEESTSPARRWKAQIATGDDEAEEGRNSLPDLPLMPETPSRFSFTVSQQPHSRYSPQPQYVEHRSSQGNHRLSATNYEFMIPPSPTVTPSWQHGRSDSVASNHESDHRIHARNLSLFFPRPDADGIVPAPQPSPSSLTQRDHEAPITLILPKDQEQAGQGFSFGLPAPPRSPSVSSGITGSIEVQGHHQDVDPSKKRRGHHVSQTMVKLDSMLIHFSLASTLHVTQLFPFLGFSDESSAICAR